MSIKVPEDGTKLNTHLIVKPFSAGSENLFFFYIFYQKIVSVSHTTEDLVFEWLPEDDTPLVVDEGIELPQLELIQNFTSDCTTNYSTGSFTCLEVVFRFKRRLGWVYCLKEANKDYNFYTNSRNLYNLYILGTSCFTLASRPV